MNSYYLTSAYRSKFDGKRLFGDSEEARAFDRIFAAQALGAMTAEDFGRAICAGDQTARRLLEFLLAEIPYASELAT